MTELSVPGARKKEKSQSLVHDYSGPNKGGPYNKSVYLKEKYLQESMKDDNWWHCSYSIRERQHHGTTSFDTSLSLLKSAAAVPQRQVITAQDASYLPCQSVS